MGEAGKKKLVVGTAVEVWRFKEPVIRHIEKRTEIPVFLLECGHVVRFEHYTGQKAMACSQCECPELWLDYTEPVLARVKRWKRAST